MADALLYRDGVRDDEEFFVLVYGVGWGKVLEFRRMYYDVIYPVPQLTPPARR